MNTEPHWLRIADAVALCGIPKTSLREYFDIYGGPVKTRSLRKPKRSWGLRLVNRESLLGFIESQTEPTAIGRTPSEAEAAVGLSELITDSKDVVQ